MTIEFILMYILLIHFLGDFALQTHEQAMLKSTDSHALAQHVGVYSAIWLIAMLPILGWSLSVVFAIITFIAHFFTDYFTSRIGKPFWAKQDFHNGFVVVGFDQILHYLQLYYTFKFFYEL